MNRPTGLLWMSWMGACIIGGFTGGFLASARMPQLVWLGFFIFGICWILSAGLLLKRRNHYVIAWITEHMLFAVELISLYAGFAALSLSYLAADRATALLWAVGDGALLGLASGLIIRPYLSTEARWRWLIVNMSCGMLALPLAVFVTHPLPSLTPDLASSLAVGFIISVGWGVVPGALLAPLLHTLPPAMEEKIQQRLTRPMTARRRWIERSLIAIGVVVGVMAGYRGRCELITCQPATWAEIFDLAQTQAAKAGPTYYIGRIRAEPTFRSKFATDGPYDLTIRIEFTSTQSNMAYDGMRVRPVYSEQTIEFADRDQWVTWQRRSGWTSEEPSVEEQQRLRRVRIGPRDVYRLTWQAAQHELSPSIDLSSASMSLYTDELPQERFGVESAWVISYFDSTDFLIYWIDAQTGKVLNQTKEHVGKP